MELTSADIQNDLDGTEYCPSLSLNPDVDAVDVVDQVKESPESDDVKYDDVKTGQI